MVLFRNESYIFERVILLPFRAYNYIVLYVSRTLFKILKEGRDNNEIKNTLGNKDPF